MYENLSTKSTRNEEKDRPGSIVTFFTSRPSCKNTGKDFPEEGEDPAPSSAANVSCVLSASRARLGIVVGEGVGVGDEGLRGDASGSTAVGGVRNPDFCEAALSSRVNDLGEESSSSSSSVNTFNSPGVNVDPAAMDRLLD